MQKTITLLFIIVTIALARKAVTQQFLQSESCKANGGPCRTPENTGTKGRPDPALNVVDTCVDAGYFEFGSFTGGNPNQVSVIHTQNFVAGFCIPPIVVLGSLSYNGAHSCTVQLSQTDPTSFNTWLQEWDQGRGDLNWHTTETWFYGAFQPGAYTFEEGMNWQAGRVASDAQEWVDVLFENGHFAEAPVVFVTPVYPGTDFDWNEQAVGAISEVTSSGFKVKVARKRADADAGSVAYPTINWFAVEQDSTNTKAKSGSFEIAKGFTTIPVQNNQQVQMAQAQTFNSEHPSQGRYQSHNKIGLHLEDFDRSETRIGGADDSYGETMGWFVWKGSNEFQQ